MQREIYKHGPLAAGYFVYEDFLSYHTGKALQTNIISRITKQKAIVNDIFYLTMYDN